MKTSSAPITIAPLMSLNDLASYTNTPKGTLYKLTSQGRGPRGIKVGRELRFRLADVDSWLDDLADVQQAVIESRVKAAAAA